MAKQFDCFNDEQIAFIDEQSLFFVATADRDEEVNVSPKGMDSLRVIDNTHLIWLNLTGSGNETAAHILNQNRMTLMWCSFGRSPLVLRAYGQAQCHQPNDPDWASLRTFFPNYHGARQIFTMTINLVQTSCGFAVPHYTFVSERTTLLDWAKQQGPTGIEQYWQEKNRLSINNKETGI